MQCAIQATLAALCEQIISLWSFNKEEHTTLLSIYTSMRENMNKTITPVLTGTWRALTRTHTKIPAYHPLRSVALQSFAEETAKILVLCRSPWTLDDAQGIVRDYFSTELSDLYDCCFRLDRVAYEGIGSFDVEVFLNKPGDIYEAECMYEVEAGSDMEKDQQNGKSTEIAFSCRLGLYKVESRSGAPPGSALQEVILLKAGIHLTSLFSTFESTA
ncbi:hypothetical protein BDP27DRAFT_980116 [Rhodocollybia butyracea]|uniref:Uncharacterized protein n=1 Tax=Rhodocollybia butyracea TaxID=206335 RepID=A0A9P5PPG8_9AGAR|nr:hypothetical protein BDP27DRAFT_980116 [Rhodocollybia butyracea]